MYLVDVHCHIEMLENLEELIAESLANGIKKIISSSVDLTSMEQNIEISQKFSEIKCCLGLHPSNVLSMNSKEIFNAIELLKTNINYATAIGEIGIDFKHAKTDLEKQKQIKVYKEQLLIAEENSLPVVIHSRYAEKKSLEILFEFSGKVLLHWFDGSQNLFPKAAAKNYFFSVGPAVLFNQEYLQKALLIPLDNLMLETDSPVEFNGIKAKPFWVKKVAEKLAAEKNISFEELAEKTTKNAEEFFGI